LVSLKEKQAALEK
jgi:hypothetical protein